MVSACDGRGRLQAVRREACIAGVPDRVWFSWPIGGDSWGGVDDLVQIRRSRAVIAVWRQASKRRASGLSGGGGRAHGV